MGVEKTPAHTRPATPDAVPDSKSQDWQMLKNGQLGDATIKQKTLNVRMNDVCYKYGKCIIFSNLTIQRGTSSFLQGYNL